MMHAECGFVLDLTMESCYNIARSDETDISLGMEDRDDNRY
jgi:hypothetical protein